MELISVIIPVYNVEKYLKRCIDSIINQTYRHIEIIVVDDGSLDTSSLICDEYALLDNRVKVIHKENGGLSSARNVGIDMAQGAFLFFVDSDDFVEKEALEILSKRLKENSADMAMGKYVLVDEEGKKISPICLEYNMEMVLSGKDLLIKNAVEMKNKFVAAWGKLYKKELFDTIRFAEGKIHEDEYIFHKICDRCKKVTLVENELYFYTQRAKGIMRSASLERRIDALEAYADRILYMKNIREDDIDVAYQETCKIFLGLTFDFYRNLGFSNYKLNEQMKKLRPLLDCFLPAIGKDSIRDMKEKISFCVLLLSPKIYKMIWGDKKSGEV